MNCLFMIQCTHVVTHHPTLRKTQSFSPPTTSWMDSQAACHMGTQMIQSFSERIFLPLNEIGPFTLHPLLWSRPYFGSTAHASGIEALTLGGVYVRQSFLGSAASRFVSYLLFTYVIVMASLVDVLPDSDCGVGIFCSFCCKCDSWVFLFTWLYCCFCCLEWNPGKVKTLHFCENQSC